MGFNVVVTIIEILHMQKQCYLPPAILGRRPWLLNNLSLVHKANMCPNVIDAQHDEPSTPSYIEKNLLPYSTSLPPYALCDMMSCDM